MIFGCLDDFFPDFPTWQGNLRRANAKGPRQYGAALAPHPQPSSRDAGRGRNTQLRVPAELLRLSG
jgi:hypothetical protein